MERSFRDERRAEEAGGTPGGGPRLLPQDVQEKRFHLAFRGYNEREVDEFLDLVTEELARLHAENRRLRDELRALRAGAAGQGATGPEAEATLRRAREEAARIVAEARARAREVLAEAEARTRAARPAEPGRPGLPAEVAVLLAREKEFLRALAGLVQSHADGLKQEVRRLREARQGPTSATGAPPSAPVPEPTQPEPTQPSGPATVPPTERTGPPAAVVAAQQEAHVREGPDLQQDARSGGLGGTPRPEGPEGEEGEDQEEERSLRELFWGEA